MWLGQCHCWKWEKRIGTYSNGLTDYNKNGLVALDESKKEIVPNNFILY